MAAAAKEDEELVMLIVEALYDVDPELSRRIGAKVDPVDASVFAGFTSDFRDSPDARRGKMPGELDVLVRARRRGRYGAWEIFPHTFRVTDGLKEGIRERPFCKHLYHAQLFLGFRHLHPLLKVSEAGQKLNCHQNLQLFATQIAPFEVFCLN